MASNSVDALRGITALILGLIVQSPVMAAGVKISGDPNQFTRGRAVYFTSNPFSQGGNSLGDVTGDGKDDLLGKCEDNAPFFNCLCLIRGRTLSSTIVNTSIDRHYCHESANGNRTIGTPLFRARLVVNEKDDRLVFQNQFMQQSLRVDSGTQTTKYTLCPRNIARLGDQNSDGAEELLFYESGGAMIRTGVQTWQEEFPCVQLGTFSYPLNSAFSYLGDVTGDHRGDLGISLDGKIVVIRAGDGLGVTFTLGFGYRFQQSSLQMLVREDLGDFDGDGVGDLLGRATIGNEQKLFLLMGPALWDPPAIDLEAPQPAGFLRVSAAPDVRIDDAWPIGDWNGDGKSDIAIRLIAGVNQSVLIAFQSSFVSGELTVTTEPPDNTVLIEGGSFSGPPVKPFDFDGDGNADFGGVLIQSTQGWAIIRGLDDYLFRNGFEDVGGP